MRLPLARSGELIIEELGDELLVYDVTSHRAHSLSADAARVWRACDGKLAVEALGSALDMDPGTVRRAIDELDQCELLDAGISASASNGAGTTRRELTLKVAKIGAAAAVMPMIVSVSTAAAGQVTGTPPTEEECQAIVITGHGCGECHNLGCCCCEPPGTGSTSVIKPCHATCGDSPDCNQPPAANCNGPTANCKL
jgi:hypothetical protein